MNEKCAVVGIFGHEKASKLAYFSLHALQHRGQEAAGISSADGLKVHTIKDRGLVMKVFNEENLTTLKGSAAIGHTRYSTAGDDSILDAQPVLHAMISEKWQLFTMGTLQMQKKYEML